METGPRFIVPSDGLEQPGIALATPGLQGEWHNHCTTEASNFEKGILKKFNAHITMTYDHFSQRFKNISPKRKAG